MTRLSRALIGVVTALALPAVGVLVQPGSGQTRDAPPRATSLATITGRVIAGDTGTPVGDATVVLRRADGPPPSPMAPTLGAVEAVPVDREGRFQLSRAPAGRYIILAVPGFSAARLLTGRHPDPTDETAVRHLVIEAGQTLEDVVIRLPPGASISGRVVDEYGEPLSSAAIGTAALLPGGGVQRDARPNSTVRTDDRGMFRIFGLPPGTYALTASAPRPVVPLEAGAAAVPPPIYYPGSLDEADAAPIVVTNGQELTGLEFVVNRRAAPHTIRGVVLNSDDLPVPEIGVRFQRLSRHAASASEPGVWAGVSMQAMSRADGTFVLPGVPDGEIVLTASRSRLGGRDYASATVSVTQDVEGVVMRLLPGVRITGQVTFEGGAAPAPLPTFYVQTVATRAGPAAEMQVQPDARRAFTLDSQVGPILIRTSPLEGWHLKSVLHDGRDITNVPTAFAGEVATIEVVMTRGGGVLTGTVQGPPGPRSEAVVLLFGDEAAQWDRRFTTTVRAPAAADGRFRITGLRPGRYLAIALRAEEASLTHATGDFFALLARSALAVEIAADEPRTLALPITSLKQ